MQTNLIVSTRDTSINNRQININVAWVNPNVTNQKLLQLATALNGLTTNTYAKSTKETKEGID